MIDLQGPSTSIYFSFYGNNFEENCLFRLENIKMKFSITL